MKARPEHKLKFNDKMLTPVGQNHNKSTARLVPNARLSVLY